MRTITGAWLLAVLATAGVASAAPGRGSSAPAPGFATPPDRALYESLSAQVMAAFDSSRGGFVGRDGAPVEGAIELALARGRDGDALALARARQTIHWMHALMDTVGGGYVTSLRDMDPRETRFEKLTSVNARRLEVLTQALAMAPDAMFERDARRVVEYFDRLLTDPRGGFYNGQLGSREFEPEANGIALQAWMRWAVRQDDARRRDMAWRTSDMLWNACRENDLGMVRRDIWGTIHEPALLSDHVEMARGCLFLFAAAGRDSDGMRAAALVRHMRVHFEDERKAGYREEYAYERFGHAHRRSRPADDNARAARLLIEYGVANADTSALGSARRTIASFARDTRPRLESAEWALALRALWAPAGDAVPARARFAPAATATASPAAKRKPARRGNRR